MKENIHSIYDQVDETLRVLKSDNAVMGAFREQVVSHDPDVRKILIEEGMVVERRHKQLSRMLITQIGYDTLAAGGSQAYLKMREVHMKRVRGRSLRHLLFGGMAAVFTLIMRLADKFLNPTITGQY